MTNVSHDGEAKWPLAIMTNNVRLMRRGYRECREGGREREIFLACIKYLGRYFSVFYRVTVFIASIERSIYLKKRSPMLSDGEIIRAIRICGAYAVIDAKDIREIPLVFILSS